MKRVIAGIVLFVLAALGLLYWLDPDASEGASGPTGVPVSERDAPRAELEAEADSATETTSHEEVREIAAEAEPALAYLLVHAKESGSFQGVSGVVLEVERLDDKTTPPLPIVMGDGEPVTDAAGIRQFIVPAGVRLRVSGSGPIEPVSIEVDAIAEGEHGIANLMVRPEGRPFHGVVLEFDTHSPIADAEIRGGKPGVVIARHELWKSSHETTDATTDSAGRFTLSASDFSGTRLKVEAGGFSPVFVHAPKGAGTAEEPYEVLLRRGGALIVHVVEGEAPVAEVTIELTAASQQLGGVHGREFQWEEVTGEDGSASFATLPSEVPLRVRIRRGDELLRALTEHVTLTAGEEREVTWQIGSGSRILGHAIDQKGAPLAAYPIVLRSAGDAESENMYLIFEQGTLDTSVTDSGGAFEFADIAPGSYWVGPKSRDNEFNLEYRLAGAAPFSQHVAVRAGEDVELTLNVYLGLTISGSVVGPDGAPANGAFLFAKAINNGRGALHTESHGGKFTLGPLAPGRFEIQAVAMLAGHGGSDPVEARAGDEDVVVRLVAAASVHVDIVDDASGEPVQASLSCFGEDQESSRSVHGQGTRGYGLDSLRPDTYSFLALTPNGAIGVLRDVELGPGPHPENLTVRVSAGGRLRLRNAGEQALPVKLLSDGFQVASSGLAGGASGVHVVPAGFVTIRIETPEGPMEEAVRVEAGAEEIVVLPFER